METSEARSGEAEGRPAHRCALRTTHSAATGRAALESWRRGSFSVVSASTSVFQDAHPDPAMGNLDPGNASLTTPEEKRGTIRGGCGFLCGRMPVDKQFRFLPSVPCAGISDTMSCRPHGSPRLYTSPQLISAMVALSQGLWKPWGACEAGRRGLLSCPHLSGGFGTSDACAQKVHSGRVRRPREAQFHSGGEVGAAKLPPSTGDKVAQSGRRLLRLSWF